MYEKNITHRKNLIIISSISVLFCIFRIIIASHPKTIGTLPDEEIYLELASGIIHTGSFSIKNIASNNTAVLYSLIISPCMLIENVFARNIAIGVLNSILVTSTIIPVYMMCKRLNYKFKTIYIIVIFVMILPDMTMSMTFMSENLFIPLSVWLFFFITFFLKEEKHKKKVILSCIISVFTYLCYLNKTISLYYCISFILLLIVIFFLEKEKRKNCIYCILSFCLVFLILKICFEYVIFKGIFGITSTVYSQIIPDLSELFALKNIAFISYAFVFNLLCSMLAFLYFPIVIPLLSIKKLDNTMKYLVLYATICIVVVINVIGVLIHFNESYMMGSMRQHIRYYSPLIIVYLMIFLKLLLEEPQKISIFVKEGSNKVLNVFNITVLYIVVFYFVFRSYNFVGVDGVLMQGINILGRKYNLTNRDYSVFSIQEFIIKTVVAFLIILGITMLHKISSVKKTIILIVLAIICVYNNIAAINVFRIDYNQYNKNLIQSMREAEIIDRYLKKLSGNTVYISSTNENSAIETYLVSPLYYTTIREIISLKNGQPYFDLGTSKIPCSYPHQYYENLKSVDYILASKNAVISNAEEIDIPGVFSLKLFKNKDSTKLYIEDSNLFPNQVGDLVTLNTENTKFYTQCTVDKKGDFISKEDISKALVYGPYKYVKAGEYKITFYYTYSGNKSGEIGFVDVTGMNAKAFDSYSNSITFDKVKVENDLEEFELRMYSYCNGIKFDKIDIQRLK